MIYDVALVSGELKPKTKPNVTLFDVRWILLMKDWGSGGRNMIIKNETETWVNYIIMPLFEHQNTKVIDAHSLLLK